MATDTQLTSPTVVRLSDLEHGQEAICFAALVKKEAGTDRNDKPYVKCHFRDKRVVIVAPFWSGNAMREEAEAWTEGTAYRLHVRGNHQVRWGMQLDVLAARPATEELDEADGYHFFDLVETSEQDPDVLFNTVRSLIDKEIDDPYVSRLVDEILTENAELFKKMPAARNFHHSYTGGLLEHVWSMTRLAVYLSKHYAKYYFRLDPPLNRSVVVAASILHDIGKLRELEYHPVEARYTKEGCLIGHVLMGRDLVRETALRIEGFPRETLLLLEHAILSHHGRRDYGAPVVPQTVEALLVSFIDDLDAKMNIAARVRLRSTTDEPFTDKVFAMENRRFYKGVPIAAPDLDDPDHP
ncbi:MAG: 3'-5' exoribonuclease YhaM family protein [Isosphaeraceae bacterium]